MASIHFADQVLRSQLRYLVKQCKNIWAIQRSKNFFCQTSKILIMTSVDDSCPKQQRMQVHIFDVIKTDKYVISKRGEKFYYHLNMLLYLSVAKNRVQNECRSADKPMKRRQQNNTFSSKFATIFFTSKQCGC